MNRFCGLAVGIVSLLGAAFASGDIVLVITTDSDLSDNGGVDEFVPVPSDGLPHTVYIWAAPTPNDETLVEFNFDLTSGGQSLSFDNAVIGQFLADVSGSLGEQELNDLQFGWSTFLGTPPVLVACPTHTLLATLDVSIVPGAKSGPDTSINLAGGDFSILGLGDEEPVPIAVSGLSRDLLSSDTVQTCADLGGTCGDGVVGENEDCDPPDGTTCDANCRRIPRCGDGILDTSEACDDGNVLGSDGCDASCQLEELPNDNCTDAIPIFDGQTVFYTIEATTDGPGHGGDCQFDGQTYNDIWYDYTASCAGEATVSLCDSDYDTDLVVYNGCECPGFNTDVLACNDDGCPGSPPQAYRSRVVVPVVQGGCYLIRVGGWSGKDAGAGVISISCDHCEMDHDCDDELYCTGVETCVDGRCQAESLPCAGQLCDESEDVCLPIPDGDVDRDGDVDLDDAAGYVRCQSGPGNVLPQCIHADLDGDGDTDIRDFTVIQLGFTGPRL